MKKFILPAILLCVLFFLSCPDSSDPVSNDDGNIGNTPPTDTQTTNPLPPIPTTVMIRPAVSSWAADGPEIAAYKQAIQVMQSRPASDPTSWAYQAAIHGSNERPAQRAWNNCQHQSYFFLSWHRMYLYFFERIVRDASGDPNFVIPYWDYSDPDHRVLPEAFRVPADASNLLYVSQRNQGVNDGFQLPASAADDAQAFTFDNFTSPPGSALSFGGQRIDEAAHFGGRNGQVEQVPHNVMHVVVGGWMSDPNFAAMDPIFWLHHANIDRLWNKWLREDPLHQNPVDDETWMNEPFEFFDENGNLIVMSGKDILDTAAQLGYKYDDEDDDSVIVSAQPLPASQDSLVEPVRKAIIVDETVGKDISVDKNSFSIKLSNQSKTALSNPVPGAKPQRYVLNIEDINYEDIPTGYFEVYLNLPNSVTEPEYTSIYYVGGMGFFGHAHDPIHAHHSGGHGKSVSFEITDLIGNQMREGEWDFDNLNLSFYLRGVVAPDGASASVLERIKPEGNIKIGKITVEAYE